MGGAAAAVVPPVVAASRCCCGAAGGVPRCQCRPLRGGSNHHSVQRVLPGRSDPRLLHVLDTLTDTADGLVALSLPLTQCRSLVSHAAELAALLACVDYSHTAASLQKVQDALGKYDAAVGQLEALVDVCDACGALDAPKYRAAPTHLFICSIILNAVK